MLEILAHANIGRVPTSHQYVIASLPDGVTVERHDPTTLPFGWDAENMSVARAVGDLWLREARSAVLLVPSVLAKLEWNALVNPAHPDAMRVSLSRAEPVVWDKRLFDRWSGSS
jgi:RES domain-containing protein